MIERDLVLRLAPTEADAPRPGPSAGLQPPGADWELLQIAGEERLLHLARRRVPLAVLLDGEAGNDLHRENPLAKALGRLPRPPRLLVHREPTATWLAGELESARSERLGRDRLAGLAAGQLNSREPHQLAERLLALSAADDAPRTIRGGNRQLRERAARALHDLSPRPHGGFLTLRNTHPEESSFLAELLEAPGMAAKVSTLFIEDLEGESPESQGAWVRRVREGQPAGMRLVFGCSESQRELPAELESRCLRLGSDPLVSENEPASSPSLDQLERRHVLAVLDGCSGNKSRAAAQLGIHRSTLHTKLRAWGLSAART